MFYYTYKTTNLVNGKFYIGVHKTKNLNDRYLGSGSILKNAIKKYGKHNFKREILKFHKSEDRMYLHEKEIVTKELIEDPNVYNIKLGGYGGFNYVNETNSEDYILARNLKANMIFKQKLKDPEFYKFWHDRLIQGQRLARLKRQNL